MRSVCCYCGILFDVKPPYENDQETHGICELCWSIVESNLKLEMAKRKILSLSIIENVGTAP